MSTITLKELLEFAAWAETEADATCLADFEDLFSAWVENDDEIAEHLVDVLCRSMPVVVSASKEPTAEQVAKARQLLNVRQVAQRSDAWYTETMDLLTASELAQIFKTGSRTRGLLVMAKTQPLVSRGGSATVPSDNMTAFDWGIRFEPVVKMIYESRYQSKIADVGRLYHTTKPRCAASPDGIVVEGARSGRLIEIKCPVTREPGATVPDEYYAQMQQQLEVCDLELCDYVEAKFRAVYSSAVPTSVQGPARHFGTIWRLEHESDGAITSRYVYGPLDEEQLVCDCVGPHEMVMERVPWELLSWNEIQVPRNRAWWQMIEPKIDSFWDDVAAARRGAFVLPESKVRRIVAEEKCMIVGLKPKSP